MPTVNLSEPLVAGGLRHTHFFNGRLLTAGDMRVEQQAMHTHLRRVGRGVGEGVIHGLEVSLNANNSGQSLRLTAGEAINRCGDALALVEQVDLGLATNDPLAGDDAGIFGDCKAVAPVTSSTATGLALLVLGPASSSEGRAPRHGFDDAGRATQCDARYEVEGVYLRLASLSTSLWPTTVQAGLSSLLTATSIPSLSKLRNLAAHGCLGTLAGQEFSRRPFDLLDGRSVYARYGVIDHLRSVQGLSDLEVPLALVFRNSSGLQFVDMWAARRTPCPREEVSLWPMLTGLRRGGEGRALFDQFQTQLQNLQTAGNANQVVATTHFRFLPPAGYLRLGSGWFDETRFFEGVSRRAGRLDPGFIRSVFQRSWFAEPIDLEASVPPELVVFSIPGVGDHRIFVRADTTTVALDDSTAPPQPPASGTTYGNIRAELVVTANPAAVEGKTIVASVFARDAKGTDYQAELYTDSSGLGDGTVKGARFNQGRATFVTPSLPIGQTYVVRAVVQGFLPASDIVKLEGRYAEVRIQLTVEPTMGAPDISVTGSGTIRYPYSKVGLVKERLIWPWPPKEYPDFDPVTDPPPYWKEWAVRWAAEYQRTHPEAPISPGDTTFYIKRGYDPKTVADSPYAFVVFGEHAAYAPVLLVSDEHKLDTKTSVLEGPEVGLSLHQKVRLVTSELDDLDLVAASYTALLTSSGGVGTAAVGRDIISQAKLKAGELRQDLA